MVSRNRISIGALVLLCIPSWIWGASPAFAADSSAKRTALDESIDRALIFLQRMQEPDGSWKAAHSGKNPAVTALAVMAFLSAGHVPGEGRFGETVEKGIRWVLASQLANGLIATEGGHEMYHHGICTL